MNEARLRVLFRRALTLSLATPLVAGASACGGTVASVSEGPGTEPGPGPDPGPGPGPRFDASVPTRDAGRDAVSDRGIEDARKDSPTCGDPDLPDVNNGCEFYRPVPCSLPADAGWLTQQECQAICDTDSGANPGAWGCRVTELSGQRVVACMTCVIGRRPEGLADDVMLQGCAGPLGQFFADMARLEAASVDAFLVLRDELAAHGAPRALRRRAERAARDEVRHAKMTARVARRFGAAAQRPSIVRPATRTLEQIALENAVEGCVRETFGALTGEHQARRAGDAKIRAMMKRIARDEARHAALSWAVDAWVRPRLDEAARARVEQATRAAVHALGEELRARLPAEVEREAGMPTPLEARALWGSLADTLWA